MATNQISSFDMIRRLRVADYLTLSNTCCGILSIFCSMQQLFITAYVLILVGFAFDILDGKVARWRNECSLLGKELDSLSDLITFGIAPIIMLYCAGFQTAADQTALIFYMICSVARLARFNVTAHLAPKNAEGKSLYYEGLPIPFAAITISTTLVFGVWMGWVSEFNLSFVLFKTFSEFHLAMALVIAVSCMMISKRLKVSPGGPLGLPIMAITT